MLQAGGYHPLRVIGVPWAVMLFLSGWDVDSIQQSSIQITGWLTEPTIWVMNIISFPTTTVLVFGFIITLTYSLFVTDKPVHTWLTTSIGAIYLGIMLGQVVGLRFLPNGFWYVLLASA